MPYPHRVTMADVAREAGVSLMTVSRVVNDKGEISSATRERVQHVIERLGYRPSNIARGLATNRTGTIGLVVIDVANPYFSEIARGVEQAAYAAGYNVFLCNTNEDPERELDVLRSLEEKRVDGLILCSSRLDDDALRDVLQYHPAVVLMNRILEDDRVSTLLVNDEAGGLIATQHLIRSGHRAIGLLAGPERSFSGQQRAVGYRAALARAGLDHVPGRERHSLPMVESGKEALLAMLHDYPEITAVFCYNDLLAVGALQACRELDRRVPEDLAVVGCDGIPLAAWVTPALTTLSVQKRKLGMEALRLLMTHINEDCPDECQLVVVEPTLVIRASAP